MIKKHFLQRFYKNYTKGFTILPPIQKTVRLYIYTLSSVSFTENLWSVFAWFNVYWLEWPYTNKLLILLEQYIFYVPYTQNNYETNLWSTDMTKPLFTKNHSLVEHSYALETLYLCLWTPPQPILSLMWPSFCC